MITKYTLVAALLAFLLIESFAIANDVGPDGKSIPDSSWQQAGSGVSVAMLLDSLLILNEQKPVLDIYIKNSSSGIEYLPRIGDGLRIQAYYINENGSKIPLEDYKPVIRSAPTPHGFTMPPMPSVIPYKPGEMVEKTIELSANQMDMIKQHPVICKFMYGQIDKGKIIFIETHPVKLEVNQ